MNQTMVINSYKQKQKITFILKDVKREILIRDHESKTIIAIYTNLKSFKEKLK